MKKKYEFVDLPKKYTKRDYVAVGKKISKRYAQETAAIYNWGDPSQPGISDLDIVLVFDKHPAALALVKRSYRFLFSKDRYIIAHPFVYIAKKDFERVRYVYPLTSFTHMHGDTVSVKTLSKKDESAALCCLLNDIIIRHYPRDFVSETGKGVVPVRNTLLRLNSLKYSIDILKRLTKKKYPAWDVFCKDVKKLRSGWFAKKDFSTLAVLVEQAFHLTFEIIEEYRDYLVKNKMVTISDPGIVKYTSIKNKTFFVPGWTVQDAMSHVQRQAQEKNAFWSLLPLELSAPLFVYAKGTGPISAHIKQHLEGTLKYKAKHAPMLKQRIEIINGQAVLAGLLQHIDFPAFFDFGYRTREGVLNKLVTFLDTIRF